MPVADWHLIAPDELGRNGSSCLTRVSAAKATFINSKSATARLAMYSNVLIIRSPASLNAYTF